MPTFIFNAGKGRKQIKVPRWVLILGSFVAVGLAVLLLLLAASLALIIVPLTILGVGITGWLARRKGGRTSGKTAQRNSDWRGVNWPGNNANQRKTAKHNDAGVIEAEYQVIEKKPKA